MPNADELRAMAVSFEAWARVTTSAFERRDYLEMAKTVRQAAAELDASARTVRQALETRDPQGKQSRRASRGPRHASRSG
jgi:hypothetical protein